MSAYVVSSETINKIVTALLLAQEDMEYHHYPRRYAEIGNELLLFEEAAEFGLTLYEMNKNAVSQRYPNELMDELPGCRDGSDKLPPYQYRQILFHYPTAVEVYKSLQCYLYQCTEGDVDELPLYQALRQWQAEIAMEIVGKMPAYEEAEWG